MEPTQQAPNSSTVAAHPVVAIEIRNELVLVNGEVLENPEDQEPHQLAVHHVARSIAGTLGRPVRAHATDTNGTMALVVHPDGQVSNLEEIASAPVGVPVDDDGLGGLDEPLSGGPDAAPQTNGRRISGRIAGESARPLFAEEEPSDPRQGANGTTREWSTSETPRVREPILGHPLRAPENQHPAPESRAAGRRVAGPEPTRAPCRSDQRCDEQHRDKPHRDEMHGEAPRGHRGYRAGPTGGQQGPVVRPGGQGLDSERSGGGGADGPDGCSFLTRHQVQQPAQTGWRGALTRMGMTTAPSEKERSERNEIHAISRHWTGPRTIAIVNGKGGSSKTPCSVILSALFARHGGSGILAWDNNQTRGTLGWRTEQGPHESHVLDLLPHAERLMLPTARAADLAAFVHHQSDDKYDVLRSNPLLTADQQRLTAADFDAVHQVASKYFRLIFIDSGNDETAPHWLRMIDHADQVVVATTTRPDHAEAGRLLLDALRERDPHCANLAERAVVVVSQADREEALADEIAAGYQGRVRAALTIPYDRAMRAPWLRFGALQAETQRGFLRAAAAVSAGL